MGKAQKATKGMLIKTVRQSLNPMAACRSAPDELFVRNINVASKETSI